MKKMQIRRLLFTGAPEKFKGCTFAGIRQTAFFGAPFPFHQMMFPSCLMDWVKARDGSLFLGRLDCCAITLFLRNPPAINFTAEQEHTFPSTGTLWYSKAQDI
ncbi:hypothetical protein DNH61_17355 [Paenibacillus sambharensis]|uniref:Uncharacterized protein n=1 Tax=Paenibacillus sambharensis TaxID=1803190 RepID=A0A2W1L622_9BACL|nr:hypothetical protein [Paenibacillus sambharensis]PZD94716.1 hypothetical protein DNH61_17355 [Paenibacillus sambharensis]